MPTGTDYLHVASRIIMGQDYNFGAIKTDQVYTVKQIAEHVWMCSQRTVRDAIRDPEDPLPAFSVGRGKQRADHRVFGSELLAWIQRQQARLRRTIPRKLSNHSNFVHALRIKKPRANDRAFKTRRFEHLTRK